MVEEAPVTIDIDVDEIAREFEIHQHLTEPFILALRQNNIKLSNSLRSPDNHLWRPLVYHGSGK